MKIRKNSGFTILELLVVVAIIGILSSIVLALFSGAQLKGRDTKRLADVREISKALALYAENHSPDYPVANVPVTITGTDPFSVILEDAGVITAIPSDPIHPSFSYTYTSTNGSDYSLSFCLEGDGIESYKKGCDAANVISP